MRPHFHSPSISGLSTSVQTFKDMKLEGDGKQLSAGWVFFGGVCVSKTTVANDRPCRQ